MSHPPHSNESDARGAALDLSIADEEERKPPPLSHEAQMETIRARIGIGGHAEAATFPNSTSRGSCTSGRVETAHSSPPSPATHQKHPPLQSWRATASADHAIVTTSVEEPTKAPHPLQPLAQTLEYEKVRIQAIPATAELRLHGSTRKSGESSLKSSTRMISAVAAMTVSKPAKVTSGTAPETSDKGAASMEQEEASAASKNQPKRRRKRAHQLKVGQTAGRWTPEEHKAFLEGLKIYGREWKKVADRIPTRTSAQIRSHAQKYFAKMARDEAIMMEQSTSLLRQPTGASSSVTLGAEGTDAVIPTNLPTSVQRNVDRILADPEGAQEEVERTLNELRERYHQLQLRLQETQRRRQPAQGADPPAGANNADNIRPPSFRDQNIDRRKRSLEDAMHPPRQQASNQQQQDDLSSVASSVSASLANASMASNREFGNEELIALHVLGGSLPRSASNQSLANEATGGSSVDLPAPPGGESPSSSLSSVAHTGNRSDSKRQRFEDDRS